MPGPSLLQAIVIAVFALLIGASTARAQGAPAVPPDLVVLRNGAMVRGTILEVRLDERAVIVLAPDGSTRTYPMDEIEYAGRAEDAPRQVWVGEEDDAADDDEPQDDGPEVDAPEDDDGLVEVEVHARRAYPIVAELAVGGRRTALCIAPCTARLPPGSYHFGVRVDDGAPLREGSAMDETLVVLREPTDLWVRYGDREAMRVVGALVTVLGVLATGTGIVASVVVSDDQRWAMIGFTGASASLLFGVGVPLVALRDSVRFDLAGPR